MKHQLKLTYSEFVSLRGVSHQMCNFRAEVFPNNSTHMMNQSHKLNLKKKKSKFSVQFLKHTGQSESGTKTVYKGRYVQYLGIEML